MFSLTVLAAVFHNSQLFLVMTVPTIVGVLKSSVVYRNMKQSKDGPLSKLKATVERTSSFGSLRLEMPRSGSG